MKYQYSHQNPVSNNWHRIIIMKNCAKGLNWGDLSLTQNALVFHHLHDNAQQAVMAIDYANIKNAGLNKNDLFIEIQGKDKLADNQDALGEARFLVYDPKPQADNSDDEDGALKKQENNPEQDMGKKSYKNLLDKLLSKAKLTQSDVKTIVTFDDISLTIPRGNYTIDFNLKSTRFHGQSYSFMIEYKHIIRGFFLPMENQAQVSIVLQLQKDNLVYHGSTAYRYIIFQIKKQIEVEACLNLDGLENPMKQRLQQQYQGPLFQILIDLLKKLVNLTIIIPDKSDFLSKKQQPCVKANIKAYTGWLYFLKKSFIFIHKPVTHVKLDEIKVIQLIRINLANKQFDIQVYLKNDERPLQFASIDKNQLENIVQYFEKKGVAIKYLDDLKMQNKEDEDYDEQNDEDFCADEVNEESSSSSSSGPEGQVSN